MKRICSLLLVFCLCLSLAGLTSCGDSSASSFTIAIPNDTTNEARALLLLEAEGLIEVDDAAGIQATVRDITSNPFGIEFSEVEAAQLPNILQDVDYAVINSNYAIDAGMKPTEEALAMEGSYSAYANILACAEGNETSDAMKALYAALTSQKVADYINETYGGAVVSVVENPTDGFDASVDYDALAGTEITVAASPSPHAELLKLAKEILAEKNVTLTVYEYTDYVQPNNVVDSGELDANFFQHTPYLDDFNASNGTHVVSVGAVHVEPMGVYSAKHTSLEDLG